jgi:sugar phosphate isomerase/epimerase
MNMERRWADEWKAAPCGIAAKEHFMATNPIALQMYTLRDAAQQNFAGTLRAVAEMGYGAVELAGLGPYTAEALQKELDALGLKVVGGHVALERMEQDMPAVIAEMQVLGAQYVIVPWLSPQRRPDAAGYKQLAGVLNSLGEQARAAGLQLCYHHHEFELAPQGDTTGLHILHAESDPELVKFELDVYWAKDAGFDPIELIGTFAGRVPLVHLKDRTATDPPTFAEVGHGTLDIPGIIAAAEHAGAQWFIVEQDISQRQPIESVRMSVEYLKTLGR